MHGRAGNGSFPPLLSANGLDFWGRNYFPGYL